MLVYIIFYPLILSFCKGFTIIKQSRFHSPQNFCKGAWNITTFTSLNHKRLQCFATCLAKNEVCDAIQEDEQNNTCQMIHFTEKFSCFKGFPVANKKPKLHINEHNVLQAKRKLFLALPRGQRAYSLGNLATGDSIESITVPSLPSAVEGNKYNPATKYKNGFVCCLGSTLDCHYWDIDSDLWQSFPSLSDYHGNGVLVVLDATLMAIGGSTPTGVPSSSVEMFNEPMGQWEPGVNLPVALVAFLAQVIDKKTVIVSGGVGDVKCKVYRFVSGETQWTTLEELPFFILYQFSLFTTLPDIGTGILAIGGATQDHPSDTFQATRQAYFWNISSSTWSEVNRFNLPNDCHAFEGIMFKFENTLIISPMYENPNRDINQFSSKMVTMDLATPDSSWVVHDNVAEKGPYTQFGFEVDEYEFS